MIASLLLFSGCDLFKPKPVAPPAVVPPPEAIPPPVTPPPEVAPPPPEVAPPEVIPTPPEVVVPPATDTLDAQLASDGDVPMTTLFGFGNASKVIFRSVSYERGFPDLTEITMRKTDETYQGIARWKIITTYQKNGVEVAETMWLSPDTLVCRGAAKSVNGTEINMACPVLGPFGTSRTSRNVQLLGNENIIVSLGQFDNTPKYSADNTTYWSASGKAFPIKYVVNNGSNIFGTYELVGWQ